MKKIIFILTIILIGISIYFFKFPYPTATEVQEEEVVIENPIYDKALSILNEMDTKSKVGQMFIAKCPPQNQTKTIEEYAVGGYILFANDFKDKSPEQTIEFISGFQDASKTPMFIAVDEEGGLVNRISKYKQFRSTPFLSPQELYLKNGFEQIRIDTEEKSIFLKNLGVNLNLAPVCDISTDPSDFMYDRTFGKNASETSLYVSEVVKAMNDNKIGSALKHFPGYGKNIDTHEYQAIDNRDYSYFVNNDFLPFKAGINSDATVVMVSHNIVSCMDSKNPASLSPEVHNTLRNELGFEGLIMTDDLDMKAISNYFDPSAAAIKAITAGNDIICSSNVDVQIPAIVSEIENGNIDIKIIDTAVLRILIAKLKLGIIPL